MVLQRVWKSCCPHVWDSWDGADGVKWVIRDLRPEDYEEAVKILLENFLPDETLCYLTELANDLDNLEGLKDTWRDDLSQRMSLGCYEEKGSKSKLVGLNVCVICCRGEDPNIEESSEGEASKNLIGALKLIGNKADVFSILGVDTYLHTLGLVVHRDYRGARLGSRLLAAGELLSLHNDIKGTSGEFTSPTSQKIAEQLGYSTAATVTTKELAEAGLDFENDKTKIIKVMVKKLTLPENLKK